MPCFRFLSTRVLSRHPFVIGLILLTVLLTVVLLLLTTRRHRINAESYDQIKEGMTYSDVERIIGFPAGDYISADLTRGLELNIVTQVHIYEELGPRDARSYWSDDTIRITVGFNADRKVAEKTLAPSRAHMSLFDRVRVWLGW
jgi:hypothetical protein